MAKTKIVSAKAEYTGGGCYLYLGSLDDGAYFIADEFCVGIYDANPLAEEKVCFTTEWHDAHNIDSHTGYDYIDFMEALKSILQKTDSVQPYGWDDAIDRYIADETNNTETTDKALYGC